MDLDHCVLWKVWPKLHCQVFTIFLHVKGITKYEDFQSTCIHSHPLSHPSVPTFKINDSYTISSSGFVSYISTRSGFEATNKKSPLWNVSPKTKLSLHWNSPTPAHKRIHAHLRLKPPIPILLFLADLSPFPLPTVNHRWGCGKLNWGWHWSNGELWPFKQSPETELVNVCTCVHTYPLRFTHNSLPRLCLFGLANGGCHGQSPEPATDLLQVGFWPLSSLRSSPDPWPLTRLILPSTLNRGQGCCWGTRRHGD